ncbi:MAG TPA: endolytic transglycosylase MltG [Acidimicrobiia bacterium]|nr:endolytic transglycosylase MltG [Acidimicrobiia bacterium]
MPTEPVPAVDLNDVDGGGPGRGEGGSGGGGGDGRGDGPAGPRSPRGGNAKVMLVLGVLIAPLLLAAAVVVVPSIVSSGGGGGTTKTAPTVAGAQYKLFLRPGLALSQIADVVATLPGHTKAGFLSAANSGRVRSHYEPPTSKSLEGLLAPDTYFIGKNESDDSILQRLVTHFDALADQIGVNSATTVTPYQTIVVASLVGQESKLPSDSPQVAAVIYNRIRAKMPLQIDATLCYAKGGCPPVPTNADKALNNPYNTYKIPGLPPTPIASVTTSALRAALAPASVPYVYYVIADSTGKLVFSTTLQQQNANIAAARRKGLL